jgi:hypothetical protein
VISEIYIITGYRIYGDFFLQRTAVSLVYPKLKLILHELLITLFLTQYINNIVENKGWVGRSRSGCGEKGLKVEPLGKE